MFYCCTFYCDSNWAWVASFSLFIKTCLVFVLFFARYYKYWTRLQISDVVRPSLITTHQTTMAGELIIGQQHQALCDWTISKMACGASVWSIRQLIRSVASQCLNMKQPSTVASSLCSPSRFTFDVFSLTFVSFHRVNTCHLMEIQRSSQSEPPWLRWIGWKSVTTAERRTHRRMKRLKSATDWMIKAA